MLILIVRFEEANRRSSGTYAERILGGGLAALVN